MAFFSSSARAFADCSSAAADAARSPSGPLACCALIGAASNRARMMSRVIRIDSLRGRARWLLNKLMDEAAAELLVKSAHQPLHINPQYLSGACVFGVENPFIRQKVVRREQRRVARCIHYLHLA